jgi:hypothetical protein
MSIDFCQRCNKRLDTDFLEYQPDGSLYCGACEAAIMERLMERAAYTLRAARKLHEDAK